MVRDGGVSHPMHAALTDRLRVAAPQCALVVAPVELIADLDDRRRPPDPVVLVVDDHREEQRRQLDGRNRCPCILKFRRLRIRWHLVFIHFNFFIGDFFKISGVGLEISCLSLRNRSGTVPNAFL